MPHPRRGRSPAVLCPRPRHRGRQKAQSPSSRSRPASRRNPARRPGTAARRRSSSSRRRSRESHRAPRSGHRPGSAPVAAGSSDAVALARLDARRPRAPPATRASRSHGPGWAHRRPRRSPRVQARVGRSRDRRRVVAAGFVRVDIHVDQPGRRDREGHARLPAAAVGLRNLVPMARMTSASAASRFAAGEPQNPVMPTSCGWSGGNTPVPMSVCATGRPATSASRQTCDAAPRVPPPRATAAASRHEARPRSSGRSRR